MVARISLGEQQTTSGSRPIDSQSGTDILQQANRKIPMSVLLLPKYLRLRREWKGADPASGHRQRLAQELAQLERAFVDMGVTPFADTQPWDPFERDSEDLPARKP